MLGLQGASARQRVRMGADTSTLAIYNPRVRVLLPALILSGCGSSEHPHTGASTSPSGVTVALSELPSTSRARLARVLEVRADVPVTATLVLDDGQGHQRTVQPPHSGTEIRTPVPGFRQGRTYAVTVTVSNLEGAPIHTEELQVTTSTIGGTWPELSLRSLVADPTRGDTIFPVRTESGGGALLMVDDCHATGFIGASGRGTHERAGIMPDILTGTFGKALGGSIGGYVSGRKVLIERLRQSARPYLFSNSLPPAVVAATRVALTLAKEGDALRDDLNAKTRWWREGLSGLGFDLQPGSHPIVPIMIGNPIMAQRMATHLDERGVYVAGFTYPVVPKGTDRLRTQISAAHTQADLEFALDAFAKAGRESGVI